LLDYDDATVLEEMRRVASMIDSPSITQREFNKHAKVSSVFLRRRFGSWRQALERAGLGDRYTGRPVSEKMRNQIARNMTEDELLDEIRRVACDLGTDCLSQENFNAVSRINAKSIINQFGSWKSALEKVGLHLSRHGRRHSDDDYFENLLAVWTFHGRQPRLRELNDAPSMITAGAYEKKWGTWKKALVAFIERVNSDTTASDQNDNEATSSPLRRKTTKRKRNVRSIPIGLRYNVLRRDRFRCVLCGASPAIDVGCILHVDHLVPVSRRGKTEMDNLRTTCQACNLGKSAKIESEKGWLPTR